MIRRLIGVIVLVILSIVTLCGCASDDVGTRRYLYGVFLGFDGKLDLLKDYETVVIDAQYYSAEEILDFRDEGHRVYSYINVGSLEDFRDYYDDYKDLALGQYEHWDEEVWVDVSNSRWQDFVIGNLATALLKKGIDGFFVDNCDVYYNYPTTGILDGLSVIMKALIGTGKKVIINGGDVFLDAYCEKGGRWSDVITGINQESVFSKILWDGNRFSTADEDDTEYFCDYVERYAGNGAEIYLLEYTTDDRLIEKIKTYCERNGFSYYISDSLELD